MSMYKCLQIAGNLYSEVEEEDTEPDFTFGTIEQSIEVSLVDSNQND